MARTRKQGKTAGVQNESVSVTWRCSETTSQTQLCACAQNLLGTREIKLYSCHLSGMSAQEARVRCSIIA